jgi:hypothetical protein
MGDRLDNYEQKWRNASPSDAYEAPMPGIDMRAKEARAALDPDYKQRLAQELQTNPAQHVAPAATPAAPPTGATGTAKGPDGKMHYTNAQGQDFGAVPE